MQSHRTSSAPCSPRACSRFSSGTATKLACYKKSLIALTCALSVAFGCQSGSQQPKQSNNQIASRASSSTPRSQASSDTGGCDAHLQDISGLFLLYSLQNKRLPESIDDVRGLPAASNMDFVCPVSKQPYVYDAVGFPAPSGAGRVILYDAAPTHAGMRMCVVINESGKGGALVTKVIALPETYFRKNQD